MIPPAAHSFRFALFLLLTTLPLAVGGCGRAPAVAGVAAPPPVSADAIPRSSASPPTREDVAVFFNVMFPPTMMRCETQMDAPAAAPGRPAVWLINVKLTLTTVADLFTAPQEADVAEINRMVQEQNALIAWRNAFAQSAFAKARYPDLRFGGGPTTPTFISLRTTKGKTLAPVYTKIAAEWQVDRWQFGGADRIDLDEMASLGEPRESFPASAVVLGSPQAQAFLTGQRETIAQATTKKAEIEATYRAMVTAATAPGTRYVGKITHDLGTVAAEVRFSSRPGGQEENAAFVVSLPNDPPYTLSFTAALNRKLPLESEVADMQAHVVRTPNNGKDSTRTVPGTMVLGIEPFARRDFTLTGDSMEGVVSAFGGRHRFSGTRAR